MSIFGVQSNSQTTSPQSLAALLQQVTQSDGGTATASGTGASGAASTDLSQPAQLFSQLQSLATSDPTKFKQVTSDFANKLTALAQQTGGSQGQFLTDLAAKFTTASQTGDASSLAPKGGGHHHHHSGGGGSSSASSAAAAYSQNSPQSLASLLSPSSSSSSASSSSSTQNAVQSLFASLSQELSS